MQFGLVRVDALKRLAAVMKKRVEGCKHTTALRMLARSCRFDSYDHLLDAVARAINSFKTRKRSWWKLGG